VTRKEARHGHYQTASKFAPIGVNCTPNNSWAADGP
jgi:hypothetical protein